MLKTAGTLAADLWSRTLAHGTGRWLALAGAVGLLCAVVGFALNLGVNLVTHLTLGLLVGWTPLLHGAHIPIPVAGTFTPWLAVPIVALGGVAAGWIAARFAADAAGGGTDLAVEAFHRRRGDIPLRTSLTKLATSFATLGCGGSAGREGPITLVGAGFGSWFATRLGLTVRDRRLLLVSGISGGIAAVFHAPLAATLFACEVLYRGRALEAEALIPAAISGVVGFVGASLLDAGWNAMVGSDTVLTGSLFTVPGGLGFTPSGWAQLAGYLLVAIACAIGARLFISLMGAAGTAARGSGLPLWARAGAGGALAAATAIGCLMLLGQVGGPESTTGFAVLGPGYGVLQHVLDAGRGWGWATALLLVAVAKMLATACTVASGGSGGVFAPSLAIGGCLGGAVGIACQGLPIAPPVAACVLTGMAAFLAAGHRTPVAAVLMVCEISGTYGLLIPAMWSTGLATLLSGDRTLIAAQARNEGDSPAHCDRHVRDVFREARVGELVDRDLPVPTLRPASTLEECRHLVASTDLDAFPVLDDGGRLLGVVALDDLRQFLGQHDADAIVRVADLVAGRALALRPEDPLTRAMRRFADSDLEDLPVVDAGGRLVGMLRRAELFRWYAGRMDRHAAELRAEGHESGSASWRRTTAFDARHDPPDSAPGT